MSRAASILAYGAARRARGLLSQVSESGFLREGTRLRQVGGARQARAGRGRRACLVGPRRSLASRPAALSCRGTISPARTCDQVASEGVEMARLPIAAPPSRRWTTFSSAGRCTTPRAASATTPDADRAGPPSPLRQRGYAPRREGRRTLSGGGGALAGGRTAGRPGARLAWRLDGIQRRGAVRGAEPEEDTDRSRDGEPRHRGRR